MLELPTNWHSFLDTSLAELGSNLGQFISSTEKSLPILTSVGTVLDSLFFLHDTVVLSILLGIMAFVLVIFAGVYSIEWSNFHLRHSKELEAILILFPLWILFLIGSPSTSLLYTLEGEEGGFGSWPLKSVGHQWFWTYSIPKESGEPLESYLGETREGKTLSQTSAALLVPCFSPIKNLVTGSDVMHSWALPSFGLKIDAIPGRLNSLIFSLQEPGSVSYGQCSELCGVNHAFMPISLKTAS